MTLNVMELHQVQLHVAAMGVRPFDGPRRYDQSKTVASQQTLRGSTRRKQRLC